jgi:DNA-binding transcriptional ArsR family regulator
MTRHDLSAAVGALARRPGASARAVAAALGIPLGTVSYHLAKARGKRYAKTRHERTMLYVVFVADREKAHDRAKGAYPDRGAAEAHAAMLNATFLEGAEGRERMRRPLAYVCFEVIRGPRAKARAK